MPCRMDMDEYSSKGRLGPRMILAGRNVSIQKNTFDGEYPVVINRIWPCPYSRLAHTLCEGFCARLANRAPKKRYPDTLLDLEYRHAKGIGLRDITVTVMVKIGPPLTLSLGKLGLLERAR